MTEIPPQPTYEQCTANAPIALSGSRTGYACWYPQMGGYSSRCLVVADDDCFTAWVWHDGDFPFDGNDGIYGQSPRELHHCDSGQFVLFGNTVERLLGSDPLND